MSELHGTLVFHATTQALANCLEDFSEETAAETVLALIKSAGVTVSEEDFPLLFDIDDGVLFAEGDATNCSPQQFEIAVEDHPVACLWVSKQSFREQPIKVPGRFACRDHQLTLIQVLSPSPKPNFQF